MKEENKIAKWEPVANIPSQLYLEGLHDDYEGFRLFLKGKDTSDRILKIQFTTYLGYRNIDETYRLKTLQKHRILTTGWPLFISKDDDFIAWIITESTGTVDNSKPYFNYIICTPNDIVEVVSDETPIVEWL
jgi:hypothetical protein